MRNALTNSRQALWAEFDGTTGHWHGELSSSALSTAIVVFALSRVDRERYEDLILGGLDWIAAHQNDDGGWGDTVDSPSNITATVLCWSAMTVDGRENGAASAWLSRSCGGLGRDQLIAAIVAHYGDDRTFSTPILMMCALSGRLGPEEAVWPEIVQLPFELSVLPSGLFRFLKLTVVSYALPALIAIGLLRHRRAPSRVAPLRWLRHRLTACALRITERMQPSNGGYEEATPLTAFVTMALVEAGEADSVIIPRAVKFLQKTVREDGGWPIDTSLATWVTVLSVTALTDGRRACLGPSSPGGSTAFRPLSEDSGHVHFGGRNAIEPRCRAAIRAWLLGQQHDQVHPLTSEGLGGWAWSDLPGAMPDADDTSGVLVALRRLGDIDADCRAAAERGIAWLLSIQNADGGIPTFCRGWGRLPFDRSCPDITAHTMRALIEWQDDVTPSLAGRMRSSLRRCVRYLKSAQRPGGEWIPLWFGNQHASGLENPTYGTAQVVIALRAIREYGVGDEIVPLLERRGMAWLAGTQRDDGGWGGESGCPATVEETALAVCALAGSTHHDAVARGVQWLVARTQTGKEFPASPIGLYFAKLWYAERLYPVVFTTWAFEAVNRAGRTRDVDAGNLLTACSFRGCEKVGPPRSKS